MKPTRTTVRTAALALAAILGCPAARGVEQAGKPDAAPKKTTFAFNVVKDGKPAGKATYLMVRTPEARDSTLSIDLGQGDDEVKLEIKADYKPDGAPISKSYVQTFKGQVQSTTGKFTGAGFSVTVAHDGKSSTDFYPAPPNAVYADASRAWFDTVRPQPDDHAEATLFDLLQARWQQATTVFVGDEPVKLGDKTVTAHLIRQTTDDGVAQNYLDDQGDPYVIVQGPIRLERQN